jgi:predicted nucleic acid-binding protein
MILLDTNVVSELMKASPNPNVIQWLDDNFATQLFISSITKAEIELGIALLPDGKRKTLLSDAASIMFKEFGTRCLALNCSAAKEYARIVADNTRCGSPISVEDAQIASIALEQNFLLATRNIRDFKKLNNHQLKAGGLMLRTESPDTRRLNDAS